MKRSLITAAVLAVSFAAPAAFAADTDTGTLTINGEVRGTTCHFETNGQTAHIKMQQIGVNSLKDLAAGQAYSAYSNKTDMPFKITCNNANEVPKIKFLPEQFDNTNNNSVTKNTGDAKGVGYALFINDERINSDGTTPIPATLGADGKYTFDISAQYARLPEAEVVAGNVDSSITLMVIAD